MVPGSGNSLYLPMLYLGKHPYVSTGDSSSAHLGKLVNQSGLRGMLAIILGGHHFRQENIDILTELPVFLPTVRVSRSEAEINNSITWW